MLIGFEVFIIVGLLSFKFLWYNCFCDFVHFLHGFSACNAYRWKKICWIKNKV